MIPNSNESLYTVRIIIRFYRKKMINNAHKTKTTEKIHRRKRESVVIERRTQ